MLLSTIVRTVKRKAHRGDPAITTDQITQDIVDCVNEAMREIVRMLPMRFFFEQGTIPVTIGTVGVPQVLPLPADCQEPSIFHYVDATGSFRRLHKISSEEEWFRLWNPQTSLSEPYHYREIGPDGSGNKQIEIYPPSQANFTLNIEYYRTKSPDLIVADLVNQLPDIPDYLQDVVEKGALYYFLKGFDDQLQSVAKADYEQSKLALENAEQSDQDSNLSLRFEGMGPSPYNPVRFTQ